jgi:UDPglucose 6-dehydrogenase|tara:strand:+ start:11861 stop:13033 length:1173 start_codon:yes stop_codon:yes gene_type:complete
VKIGFIGIGKLGLPCAEVIAEKGHDVTGYDVVNVKSDKVTVCSSIKETVKDRNIVFIAVPTPHHPDYDGKAPTAHLEPKDFGYDIVIDCIREANMHMNKDQLLVLISTVLPGTVRREFAPLVTNTRFVYNPYLIAMGTVAWDMVNPEMIMIGTDDGSTTGDAKELVDFYKTIMENDPRYEIGTWDECECIKVFYNTFISAKIGLVNMIQDVAEKQGHINVDVVTNALAKSDQRIMGPSYMKAGMGDGGACHPRDNIALRYMAQNLGLQYDIFDAIMNAREVQAKNMANYLIKIAEERSLPILLNGIAYKPGVPYTDGSYSLLVGHYCKEAGYHCIEVDPMASPQKGPFTAVALLAHPTLYCYLSEGSVVVDPWREFESKKLEVFHYGNTR